MNIDRLRDAIRLGVADPWAASVLWKDSPDPPPAPDYRGAAEATAAGNKEEVLAQSAANRVNQITPYGNLNYAVTGADPAGNPTWTGTQTLAPQQQALLDKNASLSSGLLDTANQGLGYAQQAIGRPAIDQSTLPSTRINPGETYTDASMRFMQPTFDRERSKLETQLSNQGLFRGSEAFGNASSDLSDQQNRAQLQATMMGLDKDQAARQSGIQEQAYMKNFPINIINALRTGNQVQGPQFTQVPGQQYAPGADYLGAANAQGNAANQAYQGDLASANNTNSGLFQMAGTAAMAFAL